MSRAAVRIASFSCATLLLPALSLALSPAAVRVPSAARAPTVQPAVDARLLDARGRCRRADGNRLEGVHADPADALTRRVLERVPELSSWERWYAHPRALANGHVHTILAAKLRQTRAVRYHRQLVPTADGGTLAIDLLAGIRRARRAAPARWDALLAGGAVAGAAEASTDTLFVDAPPPLDAARPMLLLASGLGGGSQDTYVRSMAATAAERGWQVAVINMRACGGSPVTSPRLFSAYRGANDDVRAAVRFLRETRLGGGGTLACVGWSNSGTIVNNVLAEQATTHPDAAHRIDAAAACATPLNMPANSANLERPFHSTVYDANLGKSLRVLWAAARDQYVVDGAPVEVPRWDGLGAAAGTFVADDALASRAGSIRELDEAVTRRQYGYDSVDEYYAAASSDQRLPLVATPLLLVNAYDDPIVPGASLVPAIEAARANPSVVLALTSHGGHLGWCERGEPAPWGGPAWVERATCGFLEAALELEPAARCETVGCEVFD